MSRQYLIPGGFFANEAATITYLMPGFGFQNEGTATTFNETLHEDLTINSVFGQTYSYTISESLTAGFGYQATTKYFTSFVPGGFFFSENGPPSFFMAGYGFYDSDNSRSVPIAPAFNNAFVALNESITADYTLTNQQVFKENPKFIFNVPLLFPANSQENGAFGEDVFGETVFGQGLLASALDRPDQIIFNPPVLFGLKAPDLTPDINNAAKKIPDTYGTGMYGEYIYGGDSSDYVKTYKLAKPIKLIMKSLQTIKVFLTNK